MAVVVYGWNVPFRQNKVHSVIFAKAMIELLELLVKGHGKYRNIMIVGPANCAKIFLLHPLFDTFSNPSNDKYAWLGVETFFEWF